MEHKCPHCRFIGEEDSHITPHGVGYHCSNCRRSTRWFSKKTPKGRIIKTGKHKGLTVAEHNETL